MMKRAESSKKKTRIQAMNQQRILDAALAVFSQFGFRGATLDQIAQHAELSKPNVLYYFRGKQEIYVNLMQQTLDQWLQPLVELDPKGDPVGEILKYALTKLEMSRQNPQASRLFANEIMHGAPMVKSVLEGDLKTLVDEKTTVIQGWIDDGKITAIDPYHLIFMIWAITQHYADFDIQVTAVLGSSYSKDKCFDDAQSTIATILVNGLKVS